jgi:hypothetical protein
MKTANAILTELVEACQPPPRCTIVMTETIPDETDEQNWLVACGPMENTRKAALFSSKVAELRLTEPTIDWSDAETVGGKGLIAHRDRSLQDIVRVAIGKILAAPERTMRDWLSRIDKEAREARNKRASSPCGSSLSHAG